MKDRRIIIGDPHGCIKEFDKLIEKVKYNPEKDELIVAGDVFDRGPDSVGVLRRMQELQALFVLGNHDEKHLRYAIHEKRKAQNSWYKNPMKPFTGQKKEIQDFISDSDLHYMLKAHNSYCLDEKWVVVHAGLERMPFHKQSKAVLRVRFIDKDTGLSSRLPNSWDQPPNSIYWADDWQGPESVIYGHAVHSLTDPKVTKSGPQSNPVYTLGIDTGCCFGGKLTAAIINKGEFIGFEQVQAEKIYKPLQKSKKED